MNNTIEKANLEVFSETLLELGKENKDIIVVTSDSRGSGKLVPFGEELPNQWNRLFDETGYNGVKFWDIINVVALLIVIATALNFQKNTEASGNQVQLITWAIFTMIGGFIVITGVSKLVMKLQERNFQSEFR